MAKISPSSKKVNPAATKPKAAGRRSHAAPAKAKIAPKRKTVTKPALAKAKPASAIDIAPMPNAKLEKKQATPQPKAMPVVEPKEKAKKPKLVRDSFTMPEAEYQVLGDVKKACLKAGVAVKKSELLRVGVALIRKLEIVELKKVLAGLAPLKAGRPKKDK